MTSCITIDALRKHFIESHQCRESFHPIFISHWTNSICSSQPSTRRRFMIEFCGQTVLMLASICRRKASYAHGRVGRFDNIFFLISLPLSPHFISWHSRMERTEGIKQMLLVRMKTDLQNLFDWHFRRRLLLAYKYIIYIFTFTPRAIHEERERERETETHLNSDLISFLVDLFLRWSFIDSFVSCKASDQLDSFSSP